MKGVVRVKTATVSAVTGRYALEKLESAIERLEKVGVEVLTLDAMKGRGRKSIKRIPTQGVTFFSQRLFDMHAARPADCRHVRVIGAEKYSGMRPGDELVVDVSVQWMDPRNGGRRAYLVEIDNVPAIRVLGVGDDGALELTTATGFVEPKIPAPQIAARVMVLGRVLTRTRHF